MLPAPRRRFEHRHPRRSFSHRVSPNRVLFDPRCSTDEVDLFLRFIPLGRRVLLGAQTTVQIVEESSRQLLPHSRHRAQESSPKELATDCQKLSSSFSLAGERGSSFTRRSSIMGSSWWLQLLGVDVDKWLLRKRGRSHRPPTHRQQTSCNDKAAQCFKFTCTWRSAPRTFTQCGLRTTLSLAGATWVWLRDGRWDGARDCHEASDKQARNDC